MMEMDFTLLARLFVAALCGGIIGWERGGTNHEAGLRTHIIVCLGAASIMVVSENLVRQYQVNQEIMRMGAQIVSGIGFLGAGSIITDGNRIRGITTAAGLWTTACVGIIIGTGNYAIGLTVVFLLILTMFGLRSVTLKLKEKSSLHETVRLELTDRDSVKNIVYRLLELDVAIRSLQTEQGKNGITVLAVLEITLPKHLPMDALMSEFARVDGVLQFMPE